MRRRLTASGIALARLCAWWARPDVDVPEGEASAAADVGTALHAVAEAEAEDVDDRAVEDTFKAIARNAGIIDKLDALNVSSRVAVDQLAAVWRAWWATWSVGKRVFTEQPLAVDLVAGGARLLPSEGQRDYSAATDAELPGTADVVAWDDAHGAELVVLDYKTGRGPHRYVDHEDQMRFLGAAAARWLKVSSVRVVVAHVTPDGVVLDERVLDSLDLAVVVHELRALAATVPDAVPGPGLHCEEDWCPAKSVCPATRALLVAAQVPDDARRRLPLVGPINDNAEAYSTIVSIDLVEAWVDERRRAVKAYADRVPVVAPDGRTYRAREVEREAPRLDVAGAEDALVRALGPEAAAAAIVTTRKTSWTSIRAAARARAAAGEKVVLKDVEEHARAELRAAGALKTSRFNAYEWKAEKASTEGKRAL